MAYFNTRARRRELGLGGDIFGGALSGAGKGASIGSVIPGGAVIGAIAGAVGGGALAFFKNRKQKKVKEEADRRQALTQNAGDYFADVSILQAFDNQFNAAFGLDMASVGAPNLNNGFNIDVEPTQIASDVNRIEGPSHSDGGVNVDVDFDGSSEFELEGGEIEKDKRVYSKRLKVPQAFIDITADEGFSISRGSYAKVAESLGRSKDKYENKLDTISQPEANTAMLMLERIENLFDNLFYTQEFSKLGKER